MGIVKPSIKPSEWFSELLLFRKQLWSSSSFNTWWHFMRRKSSNRIWLFNRSWFYPSFQRRTPTSKCRKCSPRSRSGKRPSTACPPRIVSFRIFHGKFEVFQEILFLTYFSIRTSRITKDSGILEIYSIPFQTVPKTILVLWSETRLKFMIFVGKLQHHSDLGR